MRESTSYSHLFPFIQQSFYTTKSYSKCIQHSVLTCDKSEMYQDQTAIAAISDSRSAICLLNAASRSCLSAVLSD